MRPDRTFPVEVENFYHSGIGRFAEAPKLGQMVEGSVANLPYDDYGIGTEDQFITELLDGKSSFATPPRPFESTFAKLAALVASVPDNVWRLGHADEYLPGYEPGAGAVAIRVLGPILEDVIGKGVGLRDLGSDSVTRNGHSSWFGWITTKCASSSRAISTRRRSGSCSATTICWSLRRTWPKGVITVPTTLTSVL